MRPIKFRAWLKNPRLKTWVMWDDFWIQSADGSLWDQPQTVYDTPNQEIERLFHREGVFKDDYILMQFTGLLDKNGKEIWEGDLLIENRYPNDVRECLWFEEGAGFIFKAIKDDDWVWCPNADATARGFEVIGNIYEDKNLLNGK